MEICNDRQSVFSALQGERVKPYAPFQVISKVISTTYSSGYRFGIRSGWVVADQICIGLVLSPICRFDIYQFCTADLHVNFQTIVSLARAFKEEVQCCIGSLCLSDSPCNVYTRGVKTCFCAVFF